MNNNKKAFTLVELIFIIVIIGILAALGIPKLVATRDDAKVASCTETVTLFMRDLSTYYNSQGTFSLNMQDMTNMEVYETTPITENGSDGEYYFVCDKIKENITKNDAAVTFKFSHSFDTEGNKRINFNATATSTVQGTVDGDLGNLLAKKNIATDGAGIAHFLTGIRVKR